MSNDQNNNTETVKTKTKNTITLGFITSWILGILFIIASLGSLVSTPGAFIPYLLAGLLLLPPVRKAIFDKTGRTLSTGLRIVLVIALSAIGGYSAGENIITNVESSVASSSSETTSKSSANIQTSDRNGVIVESIDMTTGQFGNRVITGIAKNTADKQLSYVQLEFNLYDVNGIQIGSTLANVNNLEPGGTWRYEAMILKNNVTTAKLKSITAW